ncbi:MAG: YvcK family protein [Gudongella sp.]|jgi:uncharacterized cofD-like protein|nr:YvcK family protein [Gudongella sp.]
MEKFLDIMNPQPKVVVIGGGTGLSVLLRGLKEKTENITAIVTVADDGGGSGRLREDLGMLPPGDIRSCLLALANTEPTMSQLLNHRFSDGELSGQNFGNLFIAAMNEIHGSFETAIKETSNVLSITGKVLPVTLADAKLIASLEDGTLAEGESKIPSIVRERNTRIAQMSMTPERSYPLVEAVKSIKEADLIVLGPGSLYTSVIPNLLVKNMVLHINKAKAPTVYVCNVMTQPGETDRYGVFDHVDAIIKHSVEGFIDYVIANTEKIPTEVLTKYVTDGAEPVYITLQDEIELKQRKIKLIEGNLVDIRNDYIRHDTHLLSDLLIGLAKK